MLQNRDTGDGSGYGIFIGQEPKEENEQKNM